jgi:hypothetical protein
MTLEQAMGESSRGVYSEPSLTVKRAPQYYHKQGH